MVWMKSLFVAYQEIGLVEKFGVFNQSSHKSEKWVLLVQWIQSGFDYSGFDIPLS